jgi:hypothetical protein
MTNKLLGSVMWVADERVEEYLSAGHKLADSAPKATKQKAKSTKKATAKK